MKKTSLFLLVLMSSSICGCNKIFISYCDRVARGTADKTWIVDQTSNDIPFTTITYRDPQAGTPGAVCVSAQGESLEHASGRNFVFEIDDANDKVLAKKTGTATAKPINMENKPKLWGGKNTTNKNTFESTECFNIGKLDPFVKVKVKKLSTNASDEAKLWNNAAFCKR